MQIPGCPLPRATFRSPYGPAPAPRTPNHEHALATPRAKPSTFAAIRVPSRFMRARRTPAARPQHPYHLTPVTFSRRQQPYHLPPSTSHLSFPAQPIARPPGASTPTTYHLTPATFPPGASNQAPSTRTSSASLAPMPVVISCTTAYLACNCVSFLPPSSPST
jgi:hypothetical protein